MYVTHIQALKNLNGVKDIHQQVTSNGKLGHTAESKTRASLVKK